MSANVARFHPAPDNPCKRDDQAPSSIRIFSVPFRLDPASIPSGAKQVDLREIPDAIVLTEPNAARLISNRVSPALAAIVPIIDATSDLRNNGVPPRLADACVGTPRRSALSDALKMLGEEIARVRSLPAAVLRSSDPKVQLLARLFVRNGKLRPRRDPNTRETIVYAEDTIIPATQNHAEALAGQGLLAREFFDKILCCPSCDSARIALRESCSACGSTNVSDEPIIHHLRCSYQGPERDFRSGSSLVCPKCRLHLEHFSIDYDRPGFLSICSECNHISSQTAVSFVCLDCDAKGKADRLITRVAFGYRMTEAGRASILTGTAFSEPLPMFGSAANSIRAFMKSHAAARAPCSVLVANVTSADAVAGGPTLERTQALYGSLLREILTAETEVIQCGSLFVALLSKDEKAEVECALPEIRESIEPYLSPRPSVEYRVYGPTDIRQIIGD